MPNDYGLVAIISVFLAVSQILVDGGLMMTLIQKKNNSDSEYSTVFWLKLGFSFLIYLMLFLFSGLIADFYGEPILKSLIKVLGITLILSSLTSVHIVKMTIELDFKIQSLIILISTIVGGLTGVILALNGLGVWSLIFQTIAINLFQIGLFWYYSKWYPTFIFNHLYVRELLKTGSGFLYSAILVIFYNNIYNIFLGKFFNPSVLGHFTRARQFEQLPENTINSLIIKVFFPILTIHKDNFSVLKLETIRIIRWSVLLVTPLMTLMAINSESIILLLLSEKWIGASKFLVVLSIAGIFIPINNVLLNIFNVLGKPKIIVIVNAFKIIFTIVLFSLLWKQDPIVIACILIIENILQLFFISFYSKRYVQLDFNTILKNLLPFLSLNLIMGLIFFLVLSHFNFLEDYHLSRILISTISYLTIYYFLNKTFRSPELLEINSMVIKKLNFFKKR